MYEICVTFATVLQFSILYLLLSQLTPSIPSGQWHVWPPVAMGTHLDPGAQELGPSHGDVLSAHKAPFHSDVHSHLRIKAMDILILDS